MQYYAGIDAHLNYLQIAVVDRAGTLHLNTRVASDDRAGLLETLSAFRPLRAVVETCPFWPWIHDLLVGAGIDFHLAHAKELRFIAHTAQKRDAVDAEVLARMLMAGLIPEAYPRPRERRELLRLVRHRAALVRMRTQLAGRIHSQLHQSGLRLEREELLRKRSREWLETRAWPRLAPEQRDIVVTHLELIDRLTGLIRDRDRRIAKEAAEDAQARLLMTIPGIGPYRGVLLSAELTPIDRFPGDAQLASYAGLAPTTRSSGGHTRHGSIPKGANRWVRGALVSAIPSHVRAAPDSRLTASYEALKARLGWRVARVAAARKLVRIIYRMLHSGEPWRN